MASGEPNKMDCPYICPTPKNKQKEVVYAAAGSGLHDNLYARPYVPGEVRPPEPRERPAGAPPRHLPQPAEGTSGDILGMGPVGPWAPGHVDWSPQAGITGVRPVVDKYSITRYSTGDWRKNNERILITKNITDKCKNVESEMKKVIGDSYDELHKARENTDSKLNQRLKNLTSWKKKVEAAEHAISEEVITLDEYRIRLKGACRILMMPEAIAKECLELRTGRYEPDLVRDEAEQELIKEVAIVGEIRRVFNDTLKQVEEMMLKLKMAKAAIESDWSDKMVAQRLDKKNVSMGPDFTIGQWHPGVARWPENSCTLEYWDHYCAESIRNCEDVRQESEDLRANLMTAITNGAQDLKLQADRTNAALAEAVAAGEECCQHLERNLKANLQEIADIENLLDYLNETLRNMSGVCKMVETRLHARNYERPNVENCRDEAQYALMAEHKLVKAKIDDVKGQVRDAMNVRNELMKYRGDLEKEIACKRKALSIDEDRCARARAHMPKPEDFAAL